MKLNEIKSAPGFEDLTPIMSVEEQDLRESNLLMYKFLSIVEDTTKQKDISRKKLAELIGTSASNITQLFRGNRLINLLTLAKLERVLDIEFKISNTSELEKTKVEFNGTQIYFELPKSLLTITTTQGEAWSAIPPPINNKEFSYKYKEVKGKTLA